MRFWIIFIVVSIVTMVIFRTVDLPVLHNETVELVIGLFGLVGLMYVAGKIYNK